MNQIHNITTIYDFRYDWAIKNATLLLDQSPNEQVLIIFNSPYFIKSYSTRGFNGDQHIYYKSLSHKTNNDNIIYNPNITYKYKYHYNLLIEQVNNKYFDPYLFTMQNNYVLYQIKNRYHNANNIYQYNEFAFFYLY